MNYFVSCIYADIDKLQKIVEDLELKENDTLWILGDLLDGDSEHPDNNVKILDYVMYNKNIKVILGDHEYFQNMRYLSMDNEDAYNAWVTYLSNMDISGKPFVDYIESEMNKDDQDSYFGSYLLSLELSEIVQIGDRYFYLVHCAPCPFPRSETLLTEWQMNVCTNDPKLDTPFWNVIRTDPIVYPFSKNQKPISQQNCFVISGQYPPDEAAKSVGMASNNSGIFYYNKTLCIGRRTPDDPLPVLGIDAAGFFVKGVY